MGSGGGWDVEAKGSQNGLPSWAIEIRAGGAESQSPFVNHLVLRFFSLFPIFLSGFGFGVSGVFPITSPLYLRQR